jgi:hypothetical protein
MELRLFPFDAACDLWEDSYYGFIFLRNNMQQEKQGRSEKRTVVAKSDGLGSILPLVSSDIQRIKTNRWTYIQRSDLLNIAPRQALLDDYQTKELPALFRALQTDSLYICMKSLSRGRATFRFFTDLWEQSLIQPNLCLLRSKLIAATAHVFSEHQYWSANNFIKRFVPQLIRISVQEGEYSDLIQTVQQCAAVWPKYLSHLLYYLLNKQGCDRRFPLHNKGVSQAYECRIDLDQTMFFWIEYMEWVWQSKSLQHKHQVNKLTELVRRYDKLVEPRRRGLLMDIGASLSGNEREIDRALTHFLKHVGLSR